MMVHPGGYVRQVIRRNLNSKLDMDNVAKVTYSTSNKTIATVSKSGKVTAKKAGAVSIKVKVTLKNGRTKTVTLKVKVE
nr:Ig-like domain-containing protein [Acetivibrio ethanolgignens]